MTPEIQEAEGRLKAAREQRDTTRVRSIEARTLADASDARAEENYQHAREHLAALFDAQFAKLMDRQRHALDEQETPADDAPEGGGEGDVAFVTVQPNPQDQAA